MTVLKDKAATSHRNSALAAGDRAERQMAFYLRRAFHARADVFVLNDIRLAQGDDAAQMDHVVCHAGGLIVIESKSVTSAVGVNERHEWRRKWNNRWKGMASPVKQAERQAAFLRNHLQDRRESLRDKKMFGLRGGTFADVDIRILVAVSDEGIITRDTPHLAPEVFKADLVDTEVERLINEQRKASGSQLSSGELRRVVDHLYDADATQSRTTVRVPPPLASTEPEPTTVPEPTPEPEPTPNPTPEPAAPRTAGSRPALAVCRHCASADVHILGGRFGYYWKCRACDGNTPADKITADGTEGRIRKQGDHFYLVAPSGEETLYHVNTSPTEDAASKA